MALIEHLLGILLASFWFNSVIVFGNTKLLRLVLWPPPRFLLHTLERELMWGAPLLPLMMQVALMPLGMIWTHEQLISCSTCSLNWCSCQLCDCKESREGIGKRQIEFLSILMLPPNFCLKTVCKTVRRNFREPTVQQSTNFQDWGAGPFVN